MRCHPDFFATWILLSLASALVLSSCSSTRTGALGDDTLVVEHRGMTDAAASTWTLSGIPRGTAIRAEDLRAMTVTGFAGTSFGAETIDPVRELQGVVDWSDPNQAAINVRRRGVSRWNELPINGVHPVGVAAAPERNDEGGFSFTKPSSWIGMGGGDGQASVTTVEPEVEKSASSDGSWYNPFSWFGGPDDSTEGVELTEPAVVGGPAAGTPGSTPPAQRFVKPESAAVAARSPEQSTEVINTAPAPAVVEDSGRWYNPLSWF